MGKEMTLVELKKFIKEETLPLIEATSGAKVKDVVTEAIEDALKPIKGDFTKAQVEQQEAIAKLRDAQGKSDLSTKKVERQKGQAFGRCVWALKKSKNDPEGAAQILSKAGDGDLAELMQNEAKRYTPEASKAMTAGDPETGGILIPQPVSAEVIDLLRARIVVMKMNPVILSMPSGNFRLPKVTQGTTAYYVGESAAATTSKVKTGHVLLSFKKLVTIVPASNDLFRFSSPGADMLIRDDIVANTSVRQDQAFLRDEGTDATPKGLLQWAIDSAQTLEANATVSLANVTSDLGALVLKLIEGNALMSRPGWLMAPKTWNYLMTVRTTNGPYAFREEMMRGTLWGFPFAFTTQIPTNLNTVGSGSNESDLYLVDFGDVVVGESENLIIDASGDAAYEEGGSVKSAYHRDETVIRAISEHDIAVRRTASIAVLRGVTWSG